MILSLVIASQRPSTSVFTFFVLELWENAKRLRVFFSTGDRSKAVMQQLQ
jgi:hypothetical protein